MSYCFASMGRSRREKIPPEYRSNGRFTLIDINKFIISCVPMVSDQKPGFASLVNEIAPE